MSGTPRMLLFGEPKSPDEAKTLTLLACASTKAWRSCLREARPLLKAPSPEPKLWLITSTWWLSISACSAFIICWKPCTPSVSAVGVSTSMMLASGAVACAHSTSSATSRSQRLWFSWPVPLLGGGGGGGGPPWRGTMSNLGLTVDGQLPDGAETAEAPQIRRPKAL